MKFSILTLMVLVAYVAILIQVATNDQPAWQALGAIAAISVILAMALAAFNPANQVSRYAGRVALTCFAIYFAVDWNDAPQSQNPPFLPHQLIARTYLLWDVAEGTLLGPDGSYIVGGSNYAPRLGQNRYPFGVYRTKPMIGFMSSLAFGLFGGLCGLVRCRKMTLSGDEKTQPKADGP